MMFSSSSEMTECSSKSCGITLAYRRDDVLLWKPLGARRLFVWEPDELLPEAFPPMKSCLCTLDIILFLAAEPDFEELILEWEPSLYDMPLSLLV